MIHVLLADDHAVVRQGLRMFLSLRPDFNVVGEAANGDEAVRLARELRPHVVLMDILMPRLDGIAATAIIKRELPNTEVVALTSVLEDNKIMAALQAGAIGYLLKDTQAEDLCRSIEAAAAGRLQLSGEIAGRLLHSVSAPETHEPLTDRETDVLRLLAEGQSNKEIAYSLGIGEKTVKTHVSSILSKLGVLSRTQAALHAVKMGLAPARR